MANTSGIDAASSKLSLGGFLQHLAGGHHYRFGIAAASQQGTHLVAGNHAADAFTNRRDHAGALQAEHGTCTGRWRIAAGALGQIRAVYGGRVVFDANLAGSKGGFLGLLPDEVAIANLYGLHRVTHQDMRILTPRSCRWRFNPETV